MNPAHARSRPNAQARPAFAPDGGLRLAPATRRRSPAWIAGGVLLVLFCALAFAVTSTRLGTRQAVLAVTHDVPVGHVLTDSDLEVVRVSVDPNLHPILASGRAAMIGRPVAVPLVAGTLLTDAQLGTPSALPAGQAVIGVALKPGQFPPGLLAGARVLLGDTSAAAGDSVGGRVQTVAAVVVGVVEPAADSGDPSTVVALQLAASAAPRLAAAGADGQVVIILLPGRS